MKNGSASILDIILSFLLGICVFPAGDQFSIFVADSGGSIKFLFPFLIGSFICSLLITTFVSFFLKFEHKPLYVNASHFAYVLLLGILYMSIRIQIKSTIFTVFMTITFGFLVTFYVIANCAQFSNSKYSLITFLSGIFTSSLLPGLSWFFEREKHDTYSSQIHSISKRLALYRVVTCAAAMSIKMITGKFGFSAEGESKVVDHGREGDTISGLNIIWLFQNKVRISLIPYCFFIASFVIQVSIPPMLHSWNIKFSHHLSSALDISEIIFYMFGFCVGSIYPISITGNYFQYYLFTFIIYLFYLGGFAFGSFYIHLFCHYWFYFIIMVTSFLLGYHMSYSLGIFISTTLNQTCIHEEHKDKPCCGDKFSGECYCRYPEIAGFKKGSTGKRFECSKLICNTSKNLEYSTDGKNAVLICVGGTEVLKSLEHCCSTDCSKCCNDECKCCVKLFGIFILDSITTSTCDNCQLTIRLEASLCEQCCTFCGSTSGGCGCSVPGGQKCCCLCVKCCEKTCEASCKCCCIRPCCCKNGSCSGKCGCSSTSNGTGTRVFICYKESDKCCIRELKPNVTPEFDGDLKTQNEFYIKNIFLSDCCHVDLQVDLHCSLKNHFFRLTGVGYKMKSTDPVSLALSKRPSDECKKQESQCCCCCTIPLVKVCLRYPGQSDQDTCKQVEKSCGCNSCPSQCGCCKDGKCCCCISCNLSLDEFSSFGKKIQTVIYKFICCTFLFISISLSLLFASTFLFRHFVKDPYVFDQKVKFKKLQKVIDKSKFNCFNEVEKRFKAFSEMNTKNFNEKDELDSLLGLLSDVMDKGSYKSLIEYSSRQSKTFMSRIPAQDPTKFNKINLCCLTGVIYAYLIILFCRTQSFFIRWEYAWQMEYYDYRKLLSPLINNISHKSKFALSLLSELRVTHAGVVDINRTRIVSWDGVYDELKSYTELYEFESKLFNEWLPFRLDLRFARFKERWSHRREYVSRWDKEQRSVFDWEPFLYELDKFNFWLETFHKYIVLFSENNEIPAKKLNKGTEVFVNYKIK